MPSPLITVIARAFGVLGRHFVFWHSHLVHQASPSAPARVDAGRPVVDSSRRNCGSFPKFADLAGVMAVIAVLRGRRDYSVLSVGAVVVGVNREPERLIQPLRWRGIVFLVPVWAMYPSDYLRLWERTSACHRRANRPGVYPITQCPSSSCTASYRVKRFIITSYYLCWA